MVFSLYEVVRVLACVRLRRGRLSLFVYAPVHLSRRRKEANYADVKGANDFVQGNKYSGKETFARRVTFRCV